MATSQGSKSTATLLKEYGLNPVKVDPEKLNEAKRQLSHASTEEAKKDQKLRHDSWMATRNKPVGC